MPQVKLPIRPGFYTENTRASSPGRWVGGDHIRFVADVPQKIGGWTKLTQEQFLGVARSLKTWTVLSGEKYIAFGTNLKAYVYNKGSIYDITPTISGGLYQNPFTTTNGSNTITVSLANHGLASLDQVEISNSQPFANITLSGTYNVASIIDANTFTINASTIANSSSSGGGYMVEMNLLYHLTNPFTTAIGSTYVIVTHVNHGRFPGDFVYFSNSTVGGLTIVGDYQIEEIIDQNTYVINAGVPATSTQSMGGGNVNYLYEINTGTTGSPEDVGYSVGAWGDNGYGTKREAVSPIYGIYAGWGSRGWGINPYSGGSRYIPAGYTSRLWSMDIFDSDLILNPRGGSIYYWGANTNDDFATVATRIPQAPIQSNVIATWPESDILISFGCTTLEGVFDPMHIRWSAADTYDVWTPASNNTSGFISLSDGNEIVAICKMRGQILIATDTAIYSMFEDGSENLFGFKSVGNARVLSQNCMVEVNGVAFYMGEDQFFTYDGNLQVLPCEVRKYVFDDLNYDQAFKVYGSINSAYNEVWWFYPSKDIGENGIPNTECDKYVVYNYQKNIWYFGTMDRTAFSDLGVVTPQPIATSPDGYLYAHELGVDADGSPLPIELQSGDMIIADRNNFSYIKSVIPDMLEMNTNVMLTLTARRYPSSAPSSYTYTYTPKTDVIGTRIKGGQINIKYSCNEQGSTFAAGDLNLLIIPTGAK